MNSKLCIRAIISGKVQGVFFRDSTQKKASSLQLSGWVKNQKNGDVALIACGDRDHVMELTDWLWQGSEHAEVSNVQWEEIAMEHFSEFEVR